MKDEIIAFFTNRRKSLNDNFRLLKVVALHKNTMWALAAGTGFLYLIRTVWSGAPSLFFLIYWFVLANIVYSSLYIFDRRKSKQLRINAVRAIKEEAETVYDVYGGGGFLGKLKGDELAYGQYAVSKKKAIGFFQMLNYVWVTVKLAVMPIIYLPLVVVMVGLMVSVVGPSAENIDALKSLTLGQALASSVLPNLLFFCYLMAFIVVGCTMLFRGSVASFGYVDYRKRELSSILSHQLPMLSLTDDWYTVLPGVVKRGIPDLKLVK